MTMDARTGRPRSEEARLAVLHAVDDLLVEVGYAALTMKGIAERAGVGRQTVYRWWSTKAEILFEAALYDAVKELAHEPTGVLADDVVGFLERLARFLTASDAGAAYRALVAAAQQDTAVAELMRSADVLGTATRDLLASYAEDLAVDLDVAVVLLVGPTFYAVLSGEAPAPAAQGAAAFLRAAAR